MELLNALSRFEDSSANGRAVTQEALEIAVMCLSPIVPHARMRCGRRWDTTRHHR
ncbi:MAG: hypothetical protein U1F35_14735 [Steroidobacteraceae bacterium]